MFNQPLIAFSILILWSVHGSLAESNEFTYVAFGSDILGTNTDPGVIFDTISVIPIGTASGVTTYLWNEVIESVETDTLSSQTVTTTNVATLTGTLVASASGFAATLDAVSGGEVPDSGVLECHYTDSVSGECSANNADGTFETTGPAITGAVAEAAPTKSLSPSSSPSSSPSPKPNGGMPYIKFDVKILIGMGVSTLAGVCITSWI